MERFEGGASQDVRARSEMRPRIAFAIESLQGHKQDALATFLNKYMFRHQSTRAGGTAQLQKAPADELEFMVESLINYVPGVLNKAPSRP